MSVSDFAREAAAQFAPSVLTDIRVRTAFSPDSTILTGQNLAQTIRGQAVTKTPPDARIERLMYAVKPTVVVTSPVFGQKVFAPYGEAGEMEYKATRKRLAIASGLIIAGALGSFIVFVKALRS